MVGNNSGVGVGNMGTQETELRVGNDGDMANISRQEGPRMTESWKSTGGRSQVQGVHQKVHAKKKKPVKKSTNKDIETVA